MLQCPVNASNSIPWLMHSQGQEWQEQWHFSFSSSMHVVILLWLRYCMPCTWHLLVWYSCPNHYGHRLLIPPCPCTCQLYLHALTFGAHHPDMALHSSPCTSVKLEFGCIQVACSSCINTFMCTARFAPQSCMVIKPKSLPMDYSKLFHSALEDLDLMVLVQQTMLDKFHTWCLQVDVDYIFCITSGSNVHDHLAVTSLLFLVELFWHTRPLSTSGVVA